MKFDENFFDDLDDDLEISGSNLDKEWLRQPQLYMKYAAANAHFRKLAGEARERAKIIEAECKADAAEDPESCLGKGVRPSNEKIAAYSAQHPRVEKARKETVVAEYRADMAQAAVFAFQQRKDALENLVRLAGMEYFASPRDMRNIDRQFGTPRPRSEEPAEEPVTRPRRRS